MSIRTTLANWLPQTAVVVVVVLAVGLAVWMKNFVGDQPVEQKKIIQQVSIIAPPPPPPPPPKQEPEPEIEEEPMEELMDESMPDEPMDNSLASDLGIDAEGAAGSDGFGLAARKGGRGLLGGGSPYAADVQTQITDLLTADDKLKYKEYSVVLKVWVDQFGKLEKYQVQQQSGNPEVEDLLRDAIASISGFGASPPLEMPQPIKLRIRSQL